MLLRQTFQFKYYIIDASIKYKNLWSLPETKYFAVQLCWRGSSKEIAVCQFVKYIFSVFHQASTARTKLLRLFLHLRRADSYYLFERMPLVPATRYQQL
mmetsp:Transcript_5481/g.15875  ORF Transcript_5481/g.15875 Transcript_5481/m.15875 type:complete len:99 (-) Transcript_5481:2707-3003(-)